MGFDFARTAISSSILLGLCSPFIGATANPLQPNKSVNGKDELAQVEVITINAPRQQSVNIQDHAVGSSLTPDLANWLQSVPGTSINRNGPITGIAQYRGLYGDRVTVSLNNLSLAGSGPNAMDTPLSYAAPMIVESISLYRGIAPISSGFDSFATSIDVKLRQAEINNSHDLSVTGQTMLGYQQLNQAKTYAGWANISQDTNGFMVFINSQQGDDHQDANGNDISPTSFDKQQLGFDYQHAWQNNQIGFGYQTTDTENSGTPALPMDIDYIKGKRANIHGEFDLYDWQISFKVGHLDSKHAMDNFSLRTNDDPSMHRYSYAEAQSTSFSLHFLQEQKNRQNAASHWVVGIDGGLNEHSNTITNPNNAMFNIANFNQVENQKFSLFMEWTGEINHSQYSVGMRIKSNDTEAAEVSHHMADSNQMVAMLVDNFNSADRKKTSSGIDWSFNSLHPYNDQVTIYAGFGVKNRAPSYQQLYLWAPMESTGGLADGKTYVGQMDLKTERAYQLDLGVNYQNGDFYFSPHIYLQYINDYIQGVPATDQTVISVANMMMGDDSPLMFANVDARIYGIDLRWHYTLTDQWLISGLANFVTAERRDIQDDLYRIAPSHTELAMSYHSDQWFSEVRLKGYAKQHKESTTNFEQETSGYFLMDWTMNYFYNDQITIRTGIQNLLDKQYASHMSGYYRSAGVMNMDMDMQNNTDPSESTLSRVPGQGRNAFLQLDFSF